MAPKGDAVELEGTITEVLPGGMFRVDVSGHSVLCTLAGRLRRRRIRVVLGDRVKIEVSPYDATRGRVVWRLG